MNARIGSMIKAEISARFSIGDHRFASIHRDEFSKFDGGLETVSRGAAPGTRYRTGRQRGCRAPQTRLRNASLVRHPTPPRTGGRANWRFDLTRLKAVFAVESPTWNSAPRRDLTD